MNGILKSFTSPPLIYLIGQLLIFNFWQMNSSEKNSYNENKVKKPTQKYYQKLNYHILVASTIQSELSYGKVTKRTRSN